VGHEGDAYLQALISATQGTAVVPVSGIRTGLRVVLRHKGLIVVAVLAGLIIALLVKMQLVPRFEAEAQVVLDTRSMHVVKFDAVLSGLLPEQDVVRTEMDVISSRAMADRVLHRLSPADLRRLEATAAVVAPLVRALHAGWAALAHHLREWMQARGWKVPDGIASVHSNPGGSPAVQWDRDDLIELIIGGLKVSNDGHSYTIRIVYTSHDAALAATLANLYAQEYLASQIDRKLHATQQVTAWLSSRLVQLRQALETSEAAVDAYRRAAGIFRDKGTGTTLTAQELSAINGELLVARSQRLDAESRLTAVQSLLRRGGDVQGLSEFLTSGVVQSLRQKQLELKRREDDINSRYTAKYPGFKMLQTELMALRQQLDGETRGVLANLANQVDVARMREAGLTRNFGQVAEKSNEGSAAEVKLEQLQREADANRSVYETFLSRYKETSEQENLQEPDAYEISWAAAPAVPSYPRSRPLLALGVIFGGLLGAACAFLCETLDQRLRSVAQVEGATGLPVLALLPSIPRHGWMRPEEYVLRRPRSTFNEALRTAWIALSLSDEGTSGKVVVITSSVPDEGKTAFCVSLARSLAVDGHRVLLIDGDLRRPGVASSFGSTKNGRLGDLLAGETDLREAVDTDLESGADYIAAEEMARHPQDLLASMQLERLLAQARALYDVVLLDTPPILVAADAALVARRADRCLFFIRWGSTCREHVASALSRLALFNVGVSGIVLSHVNMRKHAYYATGEGYYRPYGPRRKLLTIANS
jgi:polysaccharide biosynthesis transport protein